MLIFSKKPDNGAKKVENGHQSTSSIPRRSGNKPSDLAVLSIPWQTTAEDLKMYFSRFGKVVFSDIKVDAETGKSRGFGFIRFEHYESQVAAMECPIHELDGRQIVLRLTKKVKLLISLDSLRFDEFLAKRGVRNNFASAHASAGRSYPSQLT